MLKQLEYPPNQLCLSVLFVLSFDTFCHEHNLIPVRPKVYCTEGLIALMVSYCLRSWTFAFTAGYSAIPQSDICSSHGRSSKLQQVVSYLPTA